MVQIFQDTVAKCFLIGPVHKTLQAKAKKKKKRKEKKNPGTVMITFERYEAYYFSCYCVKHIRT